MKSYNPDKLTDKVKQEQEETSNLAVETLQWFLDSDRIGELYSRPDVVQALSEHLEVDHDKASIALSSVVGDIVDPVQQVTTKEGKFVGIIDYNVYGDSGAYGYVHFDDRQLQRKRVVCAKCVEQADLDEHVVHATQGEGSSNEDASWKQLLNKITSHYTNAHNGAPEEIKPGAKLVSGTTISGNTAFHAGNENNIDLTNATVVSPTKPTVEPGKLWFEPVTYGTNLYAARNGDWQLLNELRPLPNTEGYVFTDGLGEYWGEGDSQNGPSTTITSSYLSIQCSGQDETTYGTLQADEMPIDLSPYNSLTIDWKFSSQNTPSMITCTVGVLDNLGDSLSSSGTNTINSKTGTTFNQIETFDISSITKTAYIAVKAEARTFYVDEQATLSTYSIQVY